MNHGQTLDHAPSKPCCLPVFHYFSSKKKGSPFPELMSCEQTCPASPSGVITWQKAGRPWTHARASEGSAEGRAGSRPRGGGEVCSLDNSAISPWEWGKPWDPLTRVSQAGILMGSLTE